ncbi:MAG: hypothetical protein ACUVXI_03450 [bacterium]
MSKGSSLLSVPLTVTPYFGVGEGIFLMRSYERQEFTSSQGKLISLDIDKSYDPAPGFKGVVGGGYPIFENLIAFWEFKFTYEAGRPLWYKKTSIYPEIQR